MSTPYRLVGAALLGMLCWAGAAPAHDAGQSSTALPQGDVVVVPEGGPSSNDSIGASPDRFGAAPSDNAVAAPLESAAAIDAAGRIRTQLVAQHDVEISSEVAAKISRLPLKEGDAFAKGDLLVAFDCDLYQAQQRKAEATAAGAASAWATTRKLAALHSVGELDVAQTEARAKEAAADAAYMRTMVEKCEIRAPFAGRVAKRDAAEFEYVTPGKPLLEILDTAALEVKLIVPSRWLSTLKSGTAFGVHVDDLGKDYTARLVRLGARIDAVSHTVLISGRIDGKHPELLPGMSGWASFAR